MIVVQNPASGETLAEMEQAIRETLAEFAERPVSEDDLQRFKVEYESNRVFGLQSVSGKVSTLAAFETYTGSPDGITAEIDRYLGVTTEDVQRVFRKYIEGKPAVILSIVPNGQRELQAAAPNYTVPEPQLNAFSDTGFEAELRIVNSDFDRSQRPQAGSIAAVELPEVTDLRLDNGVRLLAVANEETPTTTVRLVIDAGLRDEPAGKAGITALMAALLSEATTERSAAEFAEALERIGASVSVRPGAYQTTMTVNVLSRYLEPAMALAMESLLKPAFNSEDFERVKGQTLEGLQQQRKTPRGLASRATGAVLYGPGHPLGFPQDGLPETVTAITLEDLKAFYEAHVPARLSSVLVSSDLEEQAFMPALTVLGELPTRASERAPIASMARVEGRSLYLIDKEGAAQSSVRVVHPSIPYDALGDYYMAGLMNFNLGGNFNSRINLNLREDKGYTYGARSGFSGGEELGYFSVRSEVNKEATAASVVEILKELERYADEGMSEEEYAFMRSAIGQRDALAYETPSARLRLLSPIARYGLPLEYRTKQKVMLETTRREPLNQLANKLLKPKDLAVVVVGDAASIREELEALDMPLTELNEDGLPVEP
jgi:zinc protease